MSPYSSDFYGHREKNLNSSDPPVSHTYSVPVAVALLKPHSQNDYALPLLLTPFSVCLTPIHPERLKTNVSDFLKYPQTQAGRLSLRLSLVSQWTFKFSLKVLICLVLKHGQLNTTFTLTSSYPKQIWTPKDTVSEKKISRQKMTPFGKTGIRWEISNLVKPRKLSPRCKKWQMLGRNSGLLIYLSISLEIGFQLFTFPMPGTNLDLIYA